MQYGLISHVDAQTIEKTLSLIMQSVPHETPICVTEVGLFNCQTSEAIHHYITSQGRQINYTGIDSERDKPIAHPEWMNFIKGNSNEVYNELPDESQHLIFVDALHTFPSVVADFFCYQDKVKPGGYIAFHDTGMHIDKLHGYQLIGKETDPDFCLAGVRKALRKIGLLKNKFMGWRLVFDKADPDDLAGGVCVFQKLKA